MTARRAGRHDGAVRPACRLHGDQVVGGGDGRPAESPSPHRSSTDGGTPDIDGLAAMLAPGDADAVLIARVGGILDGVPIGVVLQRLDGSIAFANAAMRAMASLAPTVPVDGLDPEAFAEAYELTAIDGRPLAPTDLPRHRVVAGEPTAETVVGSRRRGTLDPPSWSRVRSRPIVDAAGATVGVVTAVEDITTAEVTRIRVQEDARRWARLAGLSQRIVEGLDPTTAEQAVVDAALELLGTDVAGYARITNDPPAVVVGAVAGAPGTEDRIPPVGTTIPFDLAPLGGVLVLPEPFLVFDAPTAAAPWAPLMGRLGIATMATVIVGRVDRPHGILGVATTTPRTYHEEDIAIARALASLLDGAFERAAGERAVQLRIRQQEAIADLGSRVAAGLGAAGLAEEVVSVLRATYDVEAVAVMQLVRGRRRYELVAGSGVTQEDIESSRLVPGTIGAAAIASDDPVIVRDFAAPGPHPSSRVSSRLGLTSLVLARIGDRAAPWGLLGMGAARPGRFGTDDAAFVRGLANLVASAEALERAAAAVADQARRVEEARFEERTALAREIHDGLVQDLWLARLRLGLLADALAAGEPLDGPLGELGSALDRAGEDARQAVLSLRTGDAGQAALAGDLASYARDIGERLGIAIEVRTAPDLPDLSPRTEAELLRIVQEILTNAARHAAPSRVVLAATTDRRGLRIDVRDDGRGFVPSSEAEAGLGITGMRERAGLIGASVDLRSAPGRGTRVTVTLPRRAWIER